MKVCAQCGHLPDDHRYLNWPRKPPIRCDVDGCKCLLGRWVTREIVDDARYQHAQQPESGSLGRGRLLNHDHPETTHDHD